MHTDINPDASTQTLSEQYIKAAREALNRVNTVGGNRGRVHREIADLFRQMAMIGDDYGDTDASEDLVCAAKLLADATQALDETFFTERAEDVVRTARGFVALARAAGQIQESARIRARVASRR